MTTVPEERNVRKERSAAQCEAGHRGPPRTEDADADYAILKKTLKPSKRARGELSYIVWQAGEGCPGAVVIRWHSQARVSWGENPATLKIRCNGKYVGGKKTWLN